MADFVTRLMATINEGVLRYTFDDGRIILVNRSIVQMLDLDCAPEDLVGSCLKDLPILAEVEHKLCNLFKDGHVEAHNCQFYFRTQKDRAKQVVCDAFLIKDTQAGLQIVEAVFKDIASVKGTDNFQKESEQLFNTAFQAIPDPVALSVVKDGRFMEINRAFLGTMGFSREEVIGRTSQELNIWVKPEDRQRIVQLAKRDGQAFDTEVHLRRKSGVVFPALFSATFIEIHGQPAMITIAHDISVLKIAEAERERLNHELSRANQEMESLIRIVTHDLRSPLVNIQGFGQILTKTCGEIARFLTAAPLSDEMRRNIVAYHEQVEKSLRFINASVDKMNGLISGLLHLLRLGRMPLVNQPIDMNKLIQTVLEAMTFQIRKANAKVTADILPACQGDMAQISQIFSNLLDNAVKYRDSARPLRVRIWGRKEDTLSVYCIEDNGLGVAPEYQQKIWNIFYRLNPQDSIHGEGLGLTVVQRIVERHGGKIWMESDAGKGCKFFLSLPAVAEEKEA